MTDPFPNASDGIRAMPSSTVYTYTSAEMPEHRYMSDPAPEPSLSSSHAKVLLYRSPAVAYHLHPRLSDGRKPTTWDAQTPSTRRGTMIHAALLGSSVQFPVIMDDGEPAANWRKADVRAARDAALASGKFPVLAHEAHEAEEIADVLRAQLEDRGLVFSEGDAEYTIIWQADTEYGPVWCRARLDHWQHKDGSLVITDLKTTRDASAAGCERAVRQFRYEVQQAPYVEALTIAFPNFDGRVRFQFAFVELEPLPLVHVVELDAGYAEVGRREWERAKNLWAYCLSTNRWDGYPYTTTTLAAPDWYLARNGGF